MAEIPVARTGRAAFSWPVASVAAQRTSTPRLAAAETAGTRILRPPTSGPALGLAKATGRKAAAAWISTHLNLIRGADTVLVVAAVYLGYVVTGAAPDSLANRAATVTAMGVAVAWLVALEMYRTRDSKVLGIGADEYKLVASATVRIFGLMAIAAVVFSIDGADAFVTVSLPLGLAGLTLNRWVVPPQAHRRKSQGQASLPRHRGGGSRGRPLRGAAGPQEVRSRLRHPGCLPPRCPPRWDLPGRGQHGPGPLLHR